MSFVVDASVALSWCLRDEATAITDRLLDRCIAEGAVVPAIWRFEMSNGLAGAIRRRRLAPREAKPAWKLLGALRIATVDSELTEIYAVMELALENSLSVYDATYLDLAVRTGLPLATQDAQLRKAAYLRGVSTLI